MPLSVHCFIQLKSYTIRRKTSINEGIEEQYQGYSSYFNPSVSDFIVIGYNADYNGNALLLIFSLVALAIFVTIGTPLLIRAHYKALYIHAKEKDSNYIFALWAVTVVAAIVVIVIVTIDIYVLFIQRLSDGVPSVWQYYVGMSFIVLFFILDLILAMSVKKKSDFPLPYILKLMFCQNNGCCSGTNVPQTLAIWFTIMATQILTFHVAFIFLALIANPVQTISTNLLYIAALFCTVSLVTLFFVSFQTKSVEGQSKFQYIIQHVLYIILFLCVLAFLILFTTCFLRVTVYVGDTESGGLPGLFASLAPSIFLGALGFLIKKVLEKNGTQTTAAYAASQFVTSHVPQPAVSDKVICQAQKSGDAQLIRKRPEPV